MYWSSYLPIVIAEMGVQGFWLVIVAIVISTVPILVSSKEVVLPDENTMCSDDSLTKGYNCEDFDVITKDGYILRLWRFSKSGTSVWERNKQPVFLQHGVLMDGTCWFVVSHADESLPLILVDHGYDVWVSNSRGTKYSKRHVSLNLTSSDYWDFTFSELAVYDLPACLDLVVQQTGKKVHYIGHSQGTTIMFASFSQWKVTDRIKSATMLSPVVFLSHMPFGLVDALAQGYIGEIAGSFGLPDLNIMTQPLGTIIQAFCNVPGVNCFDIVALITGPNCCMNSSTAELFLHHQPQPTSIKNLCHWAQGVRKHAFAQYDYGNAATNLEHYGTVKPPPYDLEKIPKDFPLFLFYGGMDSLSIRKDVHILLGILRSKNIRELYVDNYAHLDFIEGITAKDIIYPDVVSFIQGID